MSVKCECGKTYETQKGADLCKANRHGTHKLDFSKAYQPCQSFEMDIQVYCVECGERIMSQLSTPNIGDIAIKVMPHVCEVPELLNGEGKEVKK